jgi:hypothetical protein
MQTTYAVTWAETGGALYSGKLELRPGGLSFEAGANGSRKRPVVKEVAYEELSEVRVGRTAQDRIGDRPTLILERQSGGRIRIASVVQSGIVAELAERLAGLLLGHEGPIRVVVILPLKAGVRDRVRGLLAQGPPFDPETAGLERHHVFLTDREAVFLFEASSQSVIERLVGTTDLWAAAAAWREHVAGPARLAEDAFSWAASALADADLCFGGSPGPGNSEGGEIFAPAHRRQGAM